MLRGGSAKPPRKALSLPAPRANTTRSRVPNLKSVDGVANDNTGVEIPQRREGLERSASHSKLTRLREQRSSESPPDSPPHRRYTSLRALNPRSSLSFESTKPRRQGSMRDLKSSSTATDSSFESPKPRRQNSMKDFKSSSSTPDSPVSKPQMSIRSVKRSSQSTVPSTKNLSITETTSARTAAQTKVAPKAQRIKSTKGTHRSQKSKSPRTPTKSSVSKTKDREVIGNYPGLEAVSPGSDMDEQFKEMAVYHDDMPSLVDDSVVRDAMELKRGGKHWKIMEDAPAGHAEEKLIIVQAIETDDQSGDWAIDHSEFLDEDDDIEDDDIIEDEDEHSLVMARSRRRNGLPSDPSSAHGSIGQRDGFADRDRFAPAFNNQDRWKHGTNCDKKSPALDPTVSAEESLLSDAHEADDLESSTEIVQSLHKSEDNAIVPHEAASNGGNSKTPATTKRSGGRRPGSMEAVPDLEVNSFKRDTMEFHELVDIPRQKPSKTKTQLPSRSSTGRQERKGSDSTGRSSRRQGAQEPRKERDILHARNKRLADGVPTALACDAIIRSPMSSSITSIGISLSPLTSSASNQFNRSILSSNRDPANLRHSSSKRRPNRSLNQHVERGRDHFGPVDLDDDTLGASTLSTNFTATQRTQGDTTVSERSLFRSDRASSSSHIPRIPQRHVEEFDSEDNTNDEKNVLEVTKDDRASPIQEPATLIGNAAATSSDLNKFLRRPSGDDDELLATVSSSAVSVDTSEDFSLGIPDLGSGEAPRTKAFLQLNAGEHGLVVASDVVDTKTGEVKRTETLMHLDLADTQDRLIESKETVEKGRPVVVDEIKPFEKLNDEPEPVVNLSARIYGVGASGATSPNSPKRNKKKGRLSMLKKMTSWKGKVSLDDDVKVDEK